MKEECGFILLNFIIVSGLLLMLAAGSAWFLRQTLHGQAILLHSQRAIDDVEESLLKNLDGSIFSSKLFQCLDDQARHGTILSKRSLCIRKSQGALFPQFDYDTIFRLALPCAKSAPFGNRSPSGFQLSPEAVVSKMICEDPGSISGVEVVRNGNLSLTQAQLYPHLHLVAATGYIDIPNGLDVATSLLIVAGGDLHIAELRVASERTKVTLVSATGVVKLDRVSGSPSLRAIGWKDVFVPQGSSLENNSLLPSPLDLQIVGIF